MEEYRCTIGINQPCPFTSKEEILRTWAYWEVIPHVFAPPEWRYIPKRIREEWKALIPTKGKYAVIGGTLYTRVEHILLPEGQLKRLVATPSSSHLRIILSFENIFPRKTQKPIQIRAKHADEDSSIKKILQ